jgi:hypothetical protein
MSQPQRKHKRNRAPNSQNSGVIRNIRGFVSAYLQSESGKAALARQPIRVKGDNGQVKMIWRSSAMAHAFQQAIA